MDIVLNGTITPCINSPLATAPIRPDFERDTHIKYGQGSKDTARLPRMPVPVTTGSLELAYTAYYPSSGIRGKLRRVATEVVKLLHGQGWGIDMHRYLAIGGVKGSDKEGAFDLEKTRRLRDNMPLISLFGASSGFGNEWINGKFGVSHAVPATPLQPGISTGVRTDDFIRTPKTAEYLSDEAAASLSDVINKERSFTSLRRDIKDLEERLKEAKSAKDKAATSTLSKELEELKAEFKARKEAGEKDISVQMPLSGYEYIPPGTDLLQRFTMNDANDVEAGLFFFTLERWAMKPHLGAHASHGCGLVEGRWTVRVCANDALSYDSVGEIVMKPYEGVEYQGDQLKKLVDSCKAAFLAKMESQRGTPLEKIVLQ